MYRFLILGGDPRQLYMARFLKQAGHEISLYYETDLSFSLQEAMEHSHIILCPVPFTKDQKNIHSHNRLPGLEIERFLQHLRQGHVLFGGNIPAAVKEHCVSAGVPFYDFMKMDEVACKNAVATAEGAKALAAKLKGMDARVTVAGRCKDKLAHAFCHGYDTLLLEDLDPHIHTFDFIFNTIPAMVLDAPLAMGIQPDAIVIDIASAPGGVDFDTCRKHAVRAKLCPGLPGIYSPMTSARILCQAVMDHL